MRRNSEFVGCRYLLRSHSESLTSNISRIAAVCGLITGHYQHARHAQTNTMRKRCRKIGTSGERRPAKSNFTMNYRMISQSARFLIMEQFWI